MRALPAFAVVALLVVAGCAAPSATTDTEATASDRTDASTTEATSATTTGGTTATAASTTDAGDAEDSGDSGGVPNAEELDVNDTETFENLAAMLGVDADRPRLGTQNLSRYFRSETTPRKRLLGLEEYVQHPEDDPHGLATGRGEIYVQPAGASQPVVEQVVAHEQFHSIQFQQGWTATRRAATTDGRLALSGAVEGASVWVAGEYTERYQGADVPRQIRMVEEAVEDGPDGWRVFRAPYYFGALWTEHHLDDPANVSWVYANPPETTEQLMHNLSAEAEPVRPIDLDIDADSWYGSRGDRLGEAYVWATLRGELDSNRSWTAASGWGGDELKLISGANGETRNLTWAMRWDSAADADEFVAASEAWASEREVDASFRLVRANDTVTVLLAGDEAFVDAADVSLSTGTVVVTRANESTTATATANRTTAVYVTSQESSSSS